MKGFLIRLAIFIVVYLVIINPFLGYYFDRIIMKNSLVRQAQGQFETLDSLDILILGDSHSQLAVNPILIPQAFNFSSNGESYLQTYYKAAAILGSNELGVEVLIVPLDLHSFSSFRTEKVDDDLYWRRYIDFIDLAGRLTPLTTFNLMMDSWIIPYPGNLKLVRINIDVLTGNRDMQELICGFRPVDGSYGILSGNEREKHAQTRIQHHFEGSDPLDERLLYCFRDIVNLCSIADIEVVAVSYPVSNEYLHLADNIVSRRDIILALESILNENGNLHFLDYSRMFSVTPEYFSNSDHLNDEGARLMTRRLADDLDKLNLITDPCDLYRSTRTGNI